MLSFLDGKIARFKIPKSVRFTGELPRTGTGKILKKRLRETHGSVGLGEQTPLKPPEGLRPPPLRRVGRSRTARACAARMRR